MTDTVNENERKEFSAGGYIKVFVKNFFLNSIMFGIIISVIIELANELVSSAVIRNIISFILLIFGIVKIYFAAIKETFNEGKIHKEDISKILIYVYIIFSIFLLLTIVTAYYSYANQSSFTSMFFSEEQLLNNFILKIVVNVIKYTFIAIGCRYIFLKETKNPENLI